MKDESQSRQKTKSGFDIEYWGQAVEEIKEAIKTGCNNHMVGNITRDVAVFWFEKAKETYQELAGERAIEVSLGYEAHMDTGVITFTPRNLFTEWLMKEQLRKNILPGCKGSLSEYEIKLIIAAEDAIKTEMRNGSDFDQARIGVFQRVDEMAERIKALVVANINPNKEE